MSFTNINSFVFIQLRIDPSVALPIFLHGIGIAIVKAGKKCPRRNCVQTN